MDSDSLFLTVDADHPALPGHFPGRPIVPGVLLLDLVVEDWRRRKPEAPLRYLRKMKFVSALSPEQSFSIAWGEIREGKVAFTAQSGDIKLATGQFVLA